LIGNFTRHPGRSKIPQASKFIVSAKRRDSDQEFSQFRMSTAFRLHALRSQSPIGRDTANHIGSDRGNGRSISTKPQAR
jgi:hypothetical protein